jgi:biopolymer transport protein TolR
MGFQINKGSGAQYQPMSDINVTPFVDVMLVLLVIFMVTAPMMVEGLDVNLPEASSLPMENADEKLVLTIRADKRIFLGETEIPRDRLNEILKNNQKLKTDKEILLHADQALPYGAVVEIMAALKEGGVENIGMVTDPASERVE